MYKTVSTRLQKETHDKLRECCNQKGITISDFVNKVIEKELAEPQEDIEDLDLPAKPKLKITVK